MGVIKMLMLIHTTIIVIFFVVILAIASLHRNSNITLAITQIPFKWRKTCCNEDISDQVVQTQIRPLLVSHLIDPTIKVIIIFIILKRKIIHDKIIIIRSNRNTTI